MYYPAHCPERLHSNASTPLSVTCPTPLCMDCDPLSCRLSILTKAIASLAPQKLDENAEKWLKTLPWSYADAVKKSAQKKDEPAAPKVPQEVEEPVEVAEVPEPEVADVLEEPPQHKGNLSFVRRRHVP
ncbi:unnamed protein product [Nezara viridula]|uniref:Uncharacterized protein n=1 Tax=Nezara viridula TaxID=85310 RepID=A0A9P0MSH3_NEZVI|nr:unnamed protein product [Nezara viridula]